MLRIILALFVMSVSPLSSLALGESTDQTIEVSTTGFQFVPNTWTIASSKNVTLTFSNPTVQEHEWVLLKKGTQVTLPFGEDDEAKVYWEIEAKAGEIKEGTFVSPPEPGTYDIVCGKPRHIERGMKGTLLVK